MYSSVQTILIHTGISWFAGRQQCRLFYRPVPFPVPPVVCSRCLELLQDQQGTPAPSQQRLYTCLNQSMQSVRIGWWNPAGPLYERSFILKLERCVSGLISGWIIRTFRSKMSHSLFKRGLLNSFFGTAVNGKKKLCRASIQQIQCRIIWFISQKCCPILISSHI